MLKVKQFVKPVYIFMWIRNIFNWLQNLGICTGRFVSVLLVSCWNRQDSVVTKRLKSTDMRYFASSKFSKSLVHKKNFSLVWQVLFKLEYLFCQ